MHLASFLDSLCNVSYFWHSSCSATLILPIPTLLKGCVSSGGITSVVGNLAFNFSISLVLCLIGATLVGDGFCMAWIWLPLIILPSVFISLGIGWLVHLLEFFSRHRSTGPSFWAWCSSTQVGSLLCWEILRNLWSFLRLNPVLHIVDQLRQAILWQEIPDRDILIMLWVSSLVVFQTGYWVFRRLRSDFADVL